MIISEISQNGFNIHMEEYVHWKSQKYFGKEKLQERLTTQILTWNM